MILSVFSHIGCVLDSDSVLFSMLFELSMLLELIHVLFLMLLELIHVLFLLLTYCIICSDDPMARCSMYKNFITEERFWIYSYLI